MPNYLRVLAVPGRLILHTDTFGAAQQTMVGHDPYIDEKDTRPDIFDGNRPIPMRKFTPRAEPALVPEPAAGWYYHRAIRDGDLAYLETVFDANTPEERIVVDESLKKATSENPDASRVLAAYRDSLKASKPSLE